MPLAAFDSDSAAGCHVLYTASDVTPDEIEILAQSRWPSARWTDRGRFTLSRYSWIAGPFEVSQADRRRIGVDDDLSIAYVIHTLTERGDPPWPGTEDPSGLARAFPDGMPVREEGRVAWWLLAVARRLVGSASFAPSGLVLSPSPDSALDMTVYSNLWLTPDAALHVARQVVPQFEPQRLQNSGRTRRRPSRELLEEHMPGFDESRLAEIYQRVDRSDREAVASVTLDAYALEARSEGLGTIWLEVGQDFDPPRIIQVLDWAKEGVVAYHLRWIPEDPTVLLREFPPREHIRARSQISRVLTQLARAIHQTVGVEVVDADGFAVDSRDLVD